MKPITAEWIAKAEADFATLEREARVRKNPNHDAVCFHAQQCAEKYLKARMSEADSEVTRVHDLVALLDQVLAAEPAWDIAREDLAYLSAFSVAYRYPGEAADRQAAIEARDRCRRFRAIARSALGIGGARGKK